MRVELAKYPAYKPSGVEWAGRIPINWILIRLRYVASVKARLGWKGLTASEYVEAGNIFLSTPDIKAASIDFENANFITDERYFESPEIMLQVGDVLLVKDGATLGIVNLVRQLPARATVNGSIAVIRTKHNLTPNFLFYFLKSHYLQNLIQQVKGGMGVPHLFQSDIVKFQLLIPPVEEQKQIVTFLDRETAKIDRLMAVRRKQVERLQEQRTAVIHHAVTKGLDPQAEMKPSGVDWLGDVPQGWCIHRLRRTTFKEVNGYWGDEPTGDGTDITCIRVADFDRYTRRVKDGEKTKRSAPAAKCFSRLLNVGDLLLEKSGGGEQTPVGCVVLYDKVGSAISSNFIARLSPLEDFDSNFLCYLHQALYDVGITKLSVKQTTGIQNIDSFWYLNERAPFPPKAEQEQIAAHIDRETAKLDTLIIKYRREQELLAEYRASLISHAVTGKIDVRGLVDPAP